jgi:hypothetical protein
MVLPGSKALMARDMNYVLEKTSIDRLPTFSSVVISRAANADKKDDIISARMLYAMRMYPGLIPGFQAGSSCVYSVGAVYSDDDKLKISSDAYISIMPDGTVKILKDISTKMVPIRGRDGIFSIPSKEPRIPLLIAGISERQKAKPESVASFLLAATLSPMIDAGNDIGFQIRATGKSTAVFNVSSGRTPYFFKDRDVTTNSNGSKKKIFHYVPSYTRSNGKKVVAHVKGLNRFMWNGYSIHIGKPGFDIPDLRRMTLSGYSIGSAVQPPPGMLSSEEVGDRIVKAFTSGFRPRRR